MNTLLIDGSNMLFRTYWVADTRPKLINSKGEWTGPVYLFLKSLKSLADQFKPDDIWVFWDKKLNYPSTNFRKELAPDTYKQNRDNENTLKVHEQHDLLVPWLKALGIKEMYPWVLEADDIISWMTKHKCQQATIVTVDKDMLQLVNNNIQYFNPIKKKLITTKNFEDIVGVKLEHFVNYKAILGDKSDNIEGIAGYGTLKSKKLAEQGLQKILTTLNEENIQRFKHNLKLVDISDSFTKENGEVECYEKQYLEQQNVKPDMNRFKELCNETEFYSFVKELDKWKDSFSRSGTLTSLISLLS